MRMLLIAPLLASMISTANAIDSAVLACETLIKSELIAPKTYERVSTSVVGTTVLVNYDAANIYNTPLRSTSECHFAWSESGWTLQKNFSEEKMKAEFAALIQKVQTGSLSGPEAQAKVAEIEKAHSALAIKEAIQEMAVRAAGPYPIPPTHTALSR